VTDPFFSVILPTKDRVALATSVIAHTLKQSFADFELVVVDNGSDDAASRAAAGFGDPRVRVVRTGGLNMPDNWQAGLDSARGRYVVMIEDKLFLVANALEQCAMIVKDFQCPVVTWLMGVCDGKDCPRLSAVEAVATQRLTSDTFFHYGSHCMLDRYQKHAPRGINMLVERDFAQRVQAKIGRLCRAMSPDYSIGALLLPHIESFAHVNAILGRVIKNGPSTGKAQGRRTSVATTFWQSLNMTDEELLQYVPLKIKTLHNLMVSDLFRFWRAAGLPESKVRLDLDGYFLMMIGDCVLMKKQKVEFGTERRQITSAFHARPLADRVAFLRYAFHRFVEGWPNRKLRMRENLPDAAKALGYLFKK
jgi:glycosyltransferase involved in cell wall biosynthesis